MKLSELKKAKPVTKKSSGTDDPKKYVGGWEEYTEPQGINDRQDRKVLAKESSYGPAGTTRFAPEKDVIGYSIGHKEASLIKKSKKPSKDVVRASTRALSARGKPPQLNPYKLDETIRIPFLGTLTAEYEIVDGDDRAVGFARVNEGVIDNLDYDTEATQEYRGMIMAALLDQMVTEADRNKANLSIMVEAMTGEIKHVLERFGFRHVGQNIMKRGHGAIRPASVQAPQGMVNRPDDI